MTTKSISSETGTISGYGRRDIYLQDRGLESTGDGRLSDRRLLGDLLGVRRRGKIIQFSYVSCFWSLEQSLFRPFIRPHFLSGQESQPNSDGALRWRSGSSGSSRRLHRQRPRRRLQDEFRQLPSHSPRWISTFAALSLRRQCLIHSFTWKRLLAIRWLAQVLSRRRERSSSRSQGSESGGESKTGE